MRVFQSQRIKDEAQVGAARRAVNRYASRLGFSEDELAEIAIIVQEIGTNAVRYATEGGCLHWATPHGSDAGIELFYWDKGPGIFDLERAVSDGVSTSGGLGAGLGAVRRLSDEFDLYSRVRGTTRRLVTSRRTTFGTAMLCRKWPAAAREEERAKAEAVSRHVGAWSRARAGEDVNGDGYFCGQHKSKRLLAVIDGLGHGRGANEATQAALSALERWEGEPLEEVMWSAHDALRATRGAVIGAVIIDAARETFHYSGVGNVEVRVYGSPEPVKPISTNGTMGARLSNVRVWRHPWAEGTNVVLATDGISASWDMSAYPGLLQKSPLLLAGILMRDYGRDTDDATVLVAR